MNCSLNCCRKERCKSMIRTVIVEDNPLIQKHLQAMIAGDPEFLTVAVLQDAFEAEKLAGSEQIDLILMDVQTLHNHSGLAAGGRIREKYPYIRIVIVTSLIDPEILKAAKSGAADSLWYKDHGDAELMEVIRRTLSGEHIFPDSSPEVELKEMFSSGLTPRQMDILRLFIKGLTYDEIAEELGISRNGVRWNLDQVVERGGFRNKHELLAAVIEKKLIVTTLVKEDPD